MKLLTLDADYLRPRFACAYLRIDAGKASFIETGINSSVPSLLHALRSQGLAPDQVEAIFVTHAHLDHAGGAASLMRACANAVLYAHPRAARHLIDPSRLLASARQVYGEKRFNELYGEILPVPAERVRTLEDKQEISVAGGSWLQALHTRGHANHHLCILDHDARAVFTGDSFGLAYPDLQTAGLFIFPSTSPTDFDPAAAIESVEKIRATRASSAHLTHFGAIDDLDAAAEQLKADLAFSGKLLEESRARADLDPTTLAAWIRPQLADRLEERARRIGLEIGPQEWGILRLDLDLNAQGIAFAARKPLNPKG